MEQLPVDHVGHLSDLKFIVWALVTVIVSYINTKNNNKNKE